MSKGEIMENKFSFTQFKAFDSINKKDAEKGLAVGFLLAFLWDRLKAFSDSVMKNNYNVKLNIANIVDLNLTKNKNSADSNPAIVHEQ